MQQVDVVIIGAGPVGLFQVFELGLLGLKAHIIDSLEQPGGQCMALYPQKPIYDIPASPVLSAHELINNLLLQIAPFKPEFHLGHQVTGIEEVTGLPGEAGQFVVMTNKGLELQARAVVIAAGTGMFEPVRLRVPGIEKFEGQSVHYQVMQKEHFRNKRLVVLGGGDPALDWAVSLQEIAASVTHVHRNTQFRATPASVAKMQVLCNAHLMQSLTAKVTGFTEQDGVLTGLNIAGNDGVTHLLEADEVLVLFGQAPDMTAIHRWNLAMQGQQVQVDTEKFQTSRAGIYAVGDINGYPGKKKLILSGFHEATLAAFAIKEQFEPGKKVYLQYTTSSPVMHQRLGIKGNTGIAEDA